MKLHYPPRVLALRNEMVRAIPKKPNDKQTLAHMHTFNTSRLMLIYLTWKMRLISLKPRKVLIWNGGVDPFHFAKLQSLIQPLITKVERGQDLTHHLSELVNKLGFAMPSESTEIRQREKDFILTKTGLHHFHVGVMNGKNPKVRSGRLVFADVTDQDFKIIAISDHDAFKVGSSEWSRLFKISNEYIQSQLPPNTAYMAYPTMSSGHSLELTHYSDHCDDLMMRQDQQLKERVFIDSLYSNNDATVDQDLKRPPKPNLKWHFKNLDFGVMETKTNVFFRMQFSPL